MQNLRQVWENQPRITILALGSNARQSYRAIERFIADFPSCDTFWWSSMAALRSFRKSGPSK